jgi:DNA end-binding protein Ku
MEARSIASITISFGLVAIPVKLYSATSASGGRISFNMLHAKDGSRLKQQYICAKDGEVVERSEIVKGYEFAKDQYVVFTPEEIKAFEDAGTKAVDVTEFVPLESIDPVYFDRAYYLAPDKGGAKPYTLFATALRETGRCAIGRWASHGRSHLVMLRPLESGLVMQQLYFGEEVRRITDLGIEAAPVKDAELKLAQQLIESQAADTFDPAVHVDEVKQRIEAAIARKIEGQEFTVSEERPASAANVIDLMDALRASLGNAASRPPAKKTAEKADKAEKLEKTERKPARRVSKPATAINGKAAATAPAAKAASSERRSSRR